MNFFLFFRPGFSTGSYEYSSVIPFIAELFSHIFAYRELTFLSTTQNMNFLIILRRHPSTLEMKFLSYKSLFGNYPKVGFCNNFEGFHVFIRLLVPEISKFLFVDDVSIKITNKKSCPTLPTSQYLCCCFARFLVLIYAKILSITSFALFF